MALLGVSPDIWRGRRVLVTGHTGFKGGWLSLWLERLGAKVFGFALPPPSMPSLFDAARVAEGVEQQLGDLRDMACLTSFIKQTRPEVVLHLAAQALVREGYRDPVGTLTSNVVGTMNLLEAVRGCDSVRALLVITSDKCYRNQEWLWPYRESDALGGRDPYSASKACAEIITSAWRDSFLAGRVQVATARAGNVIGGGDWAADRLVPDALRAWQAGRALNVRNPAAVRPWQHVLEPLAGYLRLAEGLLRGEHAGAWNFGPDAAEMLSVAGLLDRLASAWGETATWRAEAGEQPHEARLLTLDSSQARALLGWRPRYGIQAALEKTVDWQRAWLTGADMRAYTQTQIEDYMALSA
jgi:CDP-glucose 4,6-dehydratase